MSNVVSKGALFPEHLAKEVFNKVRAKSSLAKVCGQSPIPFNGTKEFTFTMDSEVDIVAENGSKSNGGATIAPVTIVPLKIEYGARVSNEFLFAAEEEALSILDAWTESFARKAAKGLDLMAMHGINPRTKSPAVIIGDNCFDNAVTATVDYDVAAPDANIDAALDKVSEFGYEPNGIIIAPVMRSAIASLTKSGARKYPEFAWGATPDQLGGVIFDSNATVSFNSSKDRALVGDFSAFKWGFAKELPLEVIEYGNPDNNAELGDLKGHNQVYIRSEAYVGWGILDKDAFARVVDPA